MDMIADLIRIADEYARLEGGLPDTTVSHRVFGDSKKIASLRSGGDITVGRYIGALRWFTAHWPGAAPLPECLAAFAQTQGDAA